MGDRRLGIDIAEHWRTWLGSLATDGMTKGGLSVYVTTPSAHPDINDGENVALEQRANDLFNGLLLQGVPRIERGFVVHGANLNGDIHIRGYSPMELWHRLVGAVSESGRFRQGTGGLPGRRPSRAYVLMLPTLRHASPRAYAPRFGFVARGGRTPPAGIPCWRWRGLDQRW